MSISKIILVIANYIIICFIFTTVSLGSIDFLWPLLPLYKLIYQLNAEILPDLEFGSFLLKLIGLCSYCSTVLLLLVLVINYFLRKTLDNNKFGTKDIRIKNRILRLNQKVKTIHVWSISLLAGLILFANTYSLGPDTYTVPAAIIHNSEGVSSSIFNSAEVVKKGSSDVNAANK